MIPPPFGKARRPRQSLSFTLVTKHSCSRAEVEIRSLYSVSQRKICSKCGTPQQWEMWPHCHCGSDFIVPAAKQPLGRGKDQVLSDSVLTAAIKSQQSLSKDRESFALLRWAPIVATAVLPFTFTHGHIPAADFFGAVLVAAVWLASLLLAWRTRNGLWGGFAWVAVVFGSRILGIYDLPFSQFLQWLCYVLIVAGAPLLIFPKRFLQLARLDQFTKVA
jgi:hypothetical protein